MLQGKDPRCGQPLHVQRCRGVVVLWGHNYIDHYCNVGHNYVGHNYIYHEYVGHNCIDHTYTGYNHMFMARASGTSTYPCGMPVHTLFPASLYKLWPSAHICEYVPRSGRRLHVQRRRGVGVLWDYGDTHLVRCVREGACPQMLRTAGRP